MCLFKAYPMSQGSLTKSDTLRRVVQIFREKKFYEPICEINPGTCEAGPVHVFCIVTFNIACFCIYSSWYGDYEL